jgi:hypothetical protein
MNCPHCGHEGPHPQATPNREQESVFTDQARAFAAFFECASCGKMFCEEKTLSDLVSCMREDQARGRRRGGGSGAKRQPKPGDALLRGRVEQGAPPVIPDKARETQQVDRRDVIRSVRLTYGEDALLHSIASLEGYTNVSDVLLRALADLAERMGLREKISSDC